MNRRKNWMVTGSALFLTAVMVIIFLVPGVMADSGAEMISVNINTADLEELTTLPGIGASKASAIIDFRTEHGPFSKVDELWMVRGIGSGLLVKIQKHIRVD